MLLTAALFAQTCRVLQSDYSQITLKFKSGQLKATPVTLGDKLFDALVMNDFSSQTAAGLPALPSTVRIIEVPLGQGLKFSVTSISCDTIDGSSVGLINPVVPAQPSRSKSDTSAFRLRQDLSAYQSSSFLGSPAIELQEMGVSRDRNLARVVFNPVTWNPSTNQLVVVREITIAVSQTNADIDGTKRMKRIHSNPVFNSGVETINSLGRKDANTNVPLRYTIVAHSSFRGALDDFANWKRRKGFLVDLVYTDDANVGTTTTSIRNYIMGLYTNATETSPAPTYVLLVGDVAQVPAFNLTAYGESQYSDLSYCCWTEGDNLPDCYYGRFSAQNLSQLTPQISKTLMYEQYTFPDDSYLSTAALIAGVDGGYSSDNAYRYADPTMDYVAKTYVTAANGFTNIYYYKNNTNFVPSGVTVTGSSQAASTSAALKNLYNNGCGWVNYSAHGSETSWGSPSFSNSDVNQMTNNNKPIVMIGNCCLTNSFQIDACLGEALLRKGNNAGAVGYIGGSNSTYWAEDFYWSVGVRYNISNTCNPNYDANNMGMYDHLFHTHGEPFNNWYNTMGSMIYAGNMSVESSTTGSDMKLYYWQIYHLMGDPSVMPYYNGTALTMQPNLISAAVIGISSLDVAAIPYAYIALSDTSTHTLIATAFADADGNATLFFDPINTPGSYEVLITAQGYRPSSSFVDVIPNGPFVNVNSMSPNMDIVAGNDINFDVTLENVGTDPVQSLTIEYQNLDGTMLIDTTGQIDIPGGLQNGQSITLHSVCNAHVWGSVADLTPTKIKVIVRWGNNESLRSVRNFNYTVTADRLQYVSHSLESEFENGDTTTLTVVSSNFGHATVENANVSLIGLDHAIEILNPSSVVSAIGPDSTISMDYTLVLNGEVPQDRFLPFLYIVDNGNVTLKDTIMLLFGRDLSIVTFEDNNWGGVDWTNNDYPWTLVSQGAHSGSWCARSNVFDEYASNKKSQLSFSFTSVEDDSISFYRKVSSEENYDFFKFYIDNVVVDSISGTDNGWTRSAFFVPAGTHTFKFSYEKDYSVSRGSDCAWIDDIKLPKSDADSYVYILDTICQGDDYLFNDSVISTTNLSHGIYHFCDTI